MAVSASAFGAHIIRSLDDMLGRGPLRKAGAELRGDAEKLRETLEMELKYAEDAENQVLEEDRARRWLVDLRQVLYKADSKLLEAYGAADAQAERPSLFVPAIMRHFTTNRYIKQHIKTLLEDISSVSENRPSMLKSKNKERDQCDGQELMCHDNLVGTEIELKILPLVDKLTEHHELSRHFTILAIYGLGGVGKTTISRKIFDDQRIKSAFSTRVWVSISKGSSVSQISSATCAAIGIMKSPKASSELKMIFAERRIFLVFNIYNGVPSKEGTGGAAIYGNLIEAIRMFPASEGSCALITTSDENVGSEMKSAQIRKKAEGYSLQTHRLWQLTVEEGWMLLLRAACLEQAKITPELMKIGIGILQKCNGLPLAIKAVGGVLCKKGYRQNKWVEIHDSRAFSLKDPTTGTEGGVRSSIYLSYQQAPPHLKQCFLYLSLLPLDFEIEQHWITELWISEGFIDTKHWNSLEECQEESNRNNNNEEVKQEGRKAMTLPRETPDGHGSASSDVIIEEIAEDNNQQPPNNKGKGTLHHTGDHSSNGRLKRQRHCSVQETSIRHKVQDIADMYFEELTERCLLQREDKTKGYKMHEQVRRIAESLTENEACAGDPKDVGRLSTSLYRLSFLNKGLTTIPEDLGRLKKLRTLLLCGNPISEKGLDIICKNLELLRVLDLSDTKINFVPKTLGNLVYLRHINLSRTGIRELSESIVRLRRLRFLGLQKCKYLTSLPRNIQKLPNLEYLNFRDTSIRKHTRLHNLRHLALLHGFVVDSKSSNGFVLEDLQNMSNLSDLQINIRKIIDRNIANNEVLKKKDNLRNLEMRCCFNIETLSIEELERLNTMFKQLHPHPCLVSLKIDGNYGSSYPEWLHFYELPNLQHLNLVNCNSCERLPPIWHLQKLKFLRIASLSKLQAIDMQRTEEMPLFPNLEELQIEDMADLEYWSECKDGDLPLLRKFALRGCPKLKHLPGGLEHCRAITMMELRDAGQLEVLDNIPVQELLVEAMPGLTTISNLQLMKVFTVINCPSLGILSGVNSLRHIHLEDEQLGQLPKWLEQHVSRIETLDIVGKPELLGRCERNKEDWYIIREIARVYAYLPKRLSYFSYTRSNDFLCKYPRARGKEHADEDPSALADGVETRVTSVITGCQENNNSSKEPPPAHDSSKKYKDGKFLMVLFVVLIYAFYLSSSSSLDPREALCLSVVYFIGVSAFFSSFCNMLY